jgi:hypothetical protein
MEPLAEIGDSLVPQERFKTARQDRRGNYQRDDYGRSYSAYGVKPAFSSFTH